MPYPSVAQGDLTVSIISSIYNRARAASRLAADSKKEAFKRFKSVGLTDKQAKDAVDSYSFGKEAFKSRFGGDRYRRTRGFFGSERPQDDITVNERERVLRGMGLYRRKRKTGVSDESTDGSDSETSTSGGPKGGGPTVSPLAGFLPPAKANLEDALKGVRPDGEYMTKEERIAAFRANKVSSTSSGDLTERAIFGKKQSLEDAVVKLAEEVKENRELLLEVGENTSFIEKLFDLQKDAIEDAKAEKEKSDIAQMRDSAGFSTVEKLKDVGLDGVGDLLGGFGDFAGNLLDLVGGRVGTRGARRRLAGRRFGNLKRQISGKGGPTRKPIGQRPGRGQFVNGRFYRGKVSQFAPKQKGILEKTLQRGRIASGKVGQQLLRRGGTKAVGAAGKAIGKSLIKKVPLLGLGVSALFAAQRAMAGDIVGAGMELASGAASTVPGLGTAASVGIDAALMAKDMQDQEGYERGGIVDGPDTGYPVTLHGTEAIVPLDNKFTRGEPTVTKGGEYEKGNLTISRDDQPRSMKEKNETKKELGEAFKYGLELYEKKSGKGIFGMLGDKIKKWLNLEDDPNQDPGNGGGGGGGSGTPQLSGGVAPAGVEVGKSKLQMDIEAFRKARKEQFGVSDERVATDNTFNLAIRELRGAAGGSSINELADDLSYQDIHRSAAHKHGYGFDVPVANPAQAKFVIDFFRSRGYQTIHGADDPSGKHDTHVHVQAPDEKAADFLKVKGDDVTAFDPNKKYKAGDKAIKNGKEMKFDGMGWSALDGVSSQDLGDQAQLVPPPQTQTDRAQQVQVASKEAESAKRQAIVAMASMPSNTQQPTAVSPPPRQSLTETGGKASNTAFDGLGAFVNMNQMAMTA